MSELFPTSRHALLLYRHTCRKCRVLSRLLVGLSLATIERAPISSAQADAVVRAYPHSKGKLALVKADRIVTGLPVVPAALACLFTAWLRPRTRKAAP